MFPLGLGRQFAADLIFAVASNSSSPTEPPAAKEEEGNPLAEALTTFLCVLVVILFTIFFEKSVALLRRKTPELFKPVIETLFGELTILGFIGLFAFIASGLKVVTLPPEKPEHGHEEPDKEVAKVSMLTWISFKVFCSSHADTEECKETLPEIFEHIHFIIFGNMLLFLAIVLTGLAYAIKVTERRSTWEEWCVHHTVLKMEFETKDSSEPQSPRKLQREVTSMHLDERTTPPAGCIPYYYMRRRFLLLKPALGWDFDFAEYLKSKLGDTFEEIVEVPLSAWGMVILLGITVYLFARINPYAPVVVVIVLGYILMTSSFIVYRKLTWIRYQLTPQEVKDQQHKEKVDEHKQCSVTGLMLHTPLLESAQRQRISSLSCDHDKRMLGDQIGDGYSEPIYLLRPPPDHHAGVPARHFQLYWGGHHGIHYLYQIQTTLLLLTTNYCSVLVVYLRQPLLSPPDEGPAPLGLQPWAGVLVFLVALVPVVPCLVLFGINVKNFSLTTAIELRVDEKTANGIARRIKARKSLGRLRKLTSLKYFMTKSSGEAGAKVKISNQQRAEMRELFKLIDEDDSKVVTPDEIRRKFHTLGFQLDEDELEDLIKLMDSDRSGDIDFEEFCTVMALRIGPSGGSGGMSDDEFVEELFGLFDDDNSGCLQIDEVLGALEKVGQWDLTEVQDLFKEMDTDGSGSVDKEEFRAFVKAASAGA